MIAVFGANRLRNLADFHGIERLFQQIIDLCRCKITHQTLSAGADLAAMPVRADFVGIFQSHLAEIFALHQFLPRLHDFPIRFQRILGSGIQRHGNPNLPCAYIVLQVLQRFLFQLFHHLGVHHVGFGQLGTVGMQFLLYGLHGVVAGLAGVQHLHAEMDIQRQIGLQFRP